MALATGKASLYNFKGQVRFSEKDNLEAALIDLFEWWDAQATLGGKAKLDPGNLLITLTVGSDAITFEITNPNIINALSSEPSSIYEEIGGSLGLNRKDAERLLTSIDRARVEVSTIQMTSGRHPTRSEFEENQVRTADVSPEYDQEAVLKAKKSVLLSAYIDKEDLRDPKITRSGDGKKKLEWARDVAKEMEFSRDELNRAGIRIKGKAIEAAPAKKRVQDEREPARKSKYNQEKVEEILSAIRRSGGNASKAARELGIPARTVRGIRAREMQVEEAKRPASKKEGHWTQSAKDRAIKLVEVKEMSASAAARKLGIPERTVRRWMQERTKK